MISSLLIKEPPLQVLPSLAVKIGLNEAIILQQFHYWLQRSNNIRDGRKWIYNSVANWQKQFPFWKSKTTIIKALNKLEKDGLLITGNYNKAGFDKTKWYSIDYDNLNKLTEQDGEKHVVNDVPETGKRSIRNWSMEEPETGKPIPIDYQETTQDKYNNNNSKVEKNNFGNVYNLFESEICRLNGFQRPQFIEWLNEFDSDVITYAIKHICTTDLRTTWGTFDWLMKMWRDHNLKTVDDVKNFEKQEHERNKSKKQGFKKQYQSNGKKGDSFKPSDYEKTQKQIDKTGLPF